MNMDIPYIYSAICFFMTIFGVFLLWIITGACALAMFFLHVKHAWIIYRIIGVLSLVEIFFIFQGSWLWRDGMGPDSMTSYGMEAIVRAIELAIPSLLIVGVIFGISWAIYSQKKKKSDFEPAPIINRVKIQALYSHLLFKNVRRKTKIHIFTASFIMLLYIIGAYTFTFTYKGGDSGETVSKVEYLYASRLAAEEFLPQDGWRLDQKWGYGSYSKGIWRVAARISLDHRNYRSTTITLRSKLLWPWGKFSDEGQILHKELQSKVDDFWAKVPSEEELNMAGVRQRAGVSPIK